jgi:hypothetical protein
VKIVQRFCCCHAKTRTDILGKDKRRIFVTSVANVQKWDTSINHLQNVKVNSVSRNATTQMEEEWGTGFLSNNFQHVPTFIKDVSTAKVRKRQETFWTIIMAKR